MTTDPHYTARARELLAPQVPDPERVLAATLRDHDEKLASLNKSRERDEAVAVALRAELAQSTLEAQDVVESWMRKFDEAKAERDALRAKVGELEAEVRVADDEWARRVRELEARPVLTVERLAEAIRDARDPSTFVATETAKGVMAKLGPVTMPLPAQDRAEELCRDEDHDALLSAVDDLPIVDDVDIPGGRAGAVATVRAVAAMIDRMVEEEARPVLTVERLAEAMGVGLAKMESHLRVMLKGAADTEAKEAWFYCAELISAEIRALSKLYPPPAVAGGPVLAGVSEGDIACIAANAHRECIDGSPWMAVARAVRARLGANQIALGERTKHRLDAASLLRHIVKVRGLAFDGRSPNVDDCWDMIYRLEGAPVPPAPLIEVIKDRLGKNPRAEETAESAHEHCCDPDE